MSIYIVYIVFFIMSEAGENYGEDTCKQMSFHLSNNIQHSTILVILRQTFLAHTKYHWFTVG